LLILAAPALPLNLSVCGGVVLWQAVEMIYFHKWWQEASKSQRQAARRVIKSGQLNFAVGGWVMPDEATTDYPDLIETMTAGHQFLDQTFGAKPEVRV